MKVLFVCSGNICRSAMAEGYFRHLARATGHDVEVRSAGTLDIVGASASAEAIEVMRDLGIDLTEHRSRGLDAGELSRADCIVAMTRDHLSELERRFPGNGARSFLLRAFERGARPAPGASDFEDPIGRPLAFYRAQLPVLTRCLDHLGRHLGLLD